MSSLRSKFDFLTRLVISFYISSNTSILREAYNFVFYFSICFFISSFNVLSISSLIRLISRVIKWRIRSCFHYSTSNGMSKWSLHFGCLVLPSCPFLLWYLLRVFHGYGPSSRVLRSYLHFLSIQIPWCLRTTGARYQMQRAKGAI